MIQNRILSRVSSPFFRFLHKKYNNVKPIIRNITSGIVTPIIIVVVLPPPPPSANVVVEVVVVVVVGVVDVVVVVVVVVVDVANLRQCRDSIRVPLS